MSNVFVFQNILSVSPNILVGGGWGFSKVVPTFSHVGGSFNIFIATNLGCVKNPILSNFGLYAACWAHFMCHHKLSLVIHPFSFPNNSSLGLAGGKHYQKIDIPIFRLVLQNFAIPGYLTSIIFYRYLLFWLISGWVVPKRLLYLIAHSLCKDNKT